jgi:hypothetical protein
LCRARSPLCPPQVNWPSSCSSHRAPIHDPCASAIAAQAFLQYVHRYVLDHKVHLAANQPPLSTLILPAILIIIPHNYLMSLQQCAAPRSALTRSCTLQAAPTRSIWLRSGPRPAPPGRHAAIRRQATRHHAPETHCTAPVRRRTLQRVDTPNTAASQLSSAGAVAAAAIAVLLAAGPALAFEIHTEPANALSLPTWAVHTSSVLEWITAMGLM